MFGDQAEYARLIHTLWPGGAATGVGKGRVVASRDLAAAIAQIGIRPDFRFEGGSAKADIPFAHRRLDDGDSYFLVNRKDTPERIEAHFRVTGKEPELWHAETGEIEQVSYRIADGETIMPQSDRDQSPYPRFALMVAVSTTAMFVLMYLNTYAMDHVFFSQTRAWMALLMGAAMAAGMLLFMWRMYPNRSANFAILGGSFLVFALSLWLVRSQETVDDVSYMRAMIPHHSIAIMTSERAHIRDPRVRKLADGIIAAQVREIGEMKALIADVELHPVARGKVDLAPYDKRTSPAPPP